MGLARRETDASRPVQPFAGIGLVRYDAACQALALAKSVDEVKQIQNQAEALRAYAKQAKNRQLEIDAAEIRIRAERRVGELIAAQSKTIGLSKGKPGPGRGKAGAAAAPAFGPPTLADAGIDKHLAKRARKYAGMSPDKFEEHLDEWRDRSQDPSAPVSTRIHFSSKTAEHYTPSEIIDAVVKCLGAIDLDPCSNDDRTVPATQHYTRADDGLSKPWTGRVYMNPPYGRTIDVWVTKLCAEHRRPDGVTEAIALLPSRTDTQWFLKLRDFDLCFIIGRLMFVGNKDPAPFPSLVVYLGDDLGKFVHCFERFGDIWQRVEPGVSYGE